MSNASPEEWFKGQIYIHVFFPNNVARKGSVDPLSLLMPTIFISPRFSQLLLFSSDSVWLSCFSRGSRQHGCHPICYLETAQGLTCSLFFIFSSTVHPRWPCFVVFCWGLVLIWFTVILSSVVVYKRWNQRVIIMPTLWSLVAMDAVSMTSFVASC